MIELTVEEKPKVEGLSMVCSDDSATVFYKHNNVGAADRCIDASVPLSVDELKTGVAALANHASWHYKQNGHSLSVVPGDGDRYIMSIQAPGAGANAHGVRVRIDAKTLAVMAQYAQRK